MSQAHMSSSSLIPQMSSPASSLPFLPPPPNPRLSYLLSFFFHSPQSLLLHTSTFLSPSDLLTLSTLSSSLHLIADSDTFWQRRLNAAYSVMKPPELNEGRACEWLQQLERQGQGALTPGNDRQGRSSSVVSASSPASRYPPLSPSSCKAKVLDLLQCGWHSQVHCHTLVPPCPPLSPPDLPPRRVPFAQPVAVALVLPDLLLPSRHACGRCLASLALAVKRFYDREGIWAGRFTMTPLSIVYVSQSVVDVRYRHRGGYEGTDFRRFTVHWNGESSEWRVVRMGDFESGAYAAMSDPNVRVNEELEASLLSNEEEFRQWLEWRRGQQPTMQRPLRQGPQPPMAVVLPVRGRPVVPRMRVARGNNNSS